MQGGKLKSAIENIFSRINELLHLQEMSRRIMEYIVLVMLQCYTLEKKSLRPFTQKLKNPMYSVCLKFQITDNGANYLKFSFFHLNYIFLGLEEHVHKSLLTTIIFCVW